MSPESQHFISNGHWHVIIGSNNSMLPNRYPRLNRMLIFAFMYCKNLVINAINSLWPSDAIWPRRYWSAMITVMACCRAAPSHYVNQCWFIMNEILWHSFQGNVYWNTVHWNTQDVNLKVVFEMYTFEITATSARGQWVNALNVWGGRYGLFDWFDSFSLKFGWIYFKIHCWLSARLQ